MSPSSSQGAEGSGHDRGHERGASVSFGHVRRSNVGRDRSSGGSHGERDRSSGGGHGERRRSSSGGRDHHDDGRTDRGREEDGSEVKGEEDGDVPDPDESTPEEENHGWTLRGVNFGVGSGTSGLHGSAVSSSNISSSSPAGSSAEQTKPKRKSRWDT